MFTHEEGQRERERMGGWKEADQKNVDVRKEGKTGPSYVE